MDFLKECLVLAESIDFKEQIIDVLLYMGVIHREKGELEKALEFTNRSIMVSEKNGFSINFVMGLHLLISCKLDQGKMEESLSINLNAVKARPEDALAHSQLGQSYYYLADLDRAERHLKQAKALDPKHFSFPQLVLAEIYQLKENYPSLIGELEEFFKYHPDSKRVPEVTELLKQARTHEGK